MDRCDACYLAGPTSPCVACGTHLCRSCEDVHDRFAHDPTLTAGLRQPAAADRLLG